MRVRVCPVNELPPGSSTVVHTDVGHVAVYNVGGKFYAIDDLCPHMRESLAQGDLRGGIVRCGGHGWRFDVRTGKSPDFDGVKVDTFPVDVAEGEVFVLLAGEVDEWAGDGSADPDDVEAATETAED